MKSYAREAGRALVIIALIFLLLFAVVTMAASPSVAHEGHDHGAPAVKVTAAAPRVEASSESFELVGIVRDKSMILFLDRFADNEPVIRATIDVTLDAGTVRAEPQPDGSFLVEAPWLANAGRLDLVFAIATDETSDLLIGTLDIPAETAGEAVGEAADKSISALPAQSPVLWIIGVALLLVGLALGRSLAPRRNGAPQAPPAVPPATSTPASDIGSKRRAGAVAVLALLAIATPARVLIAADSPHRLADGSLFVPKPTQRLLTIRTQQARTGEASRTATISGRVIADPSAGGRVQAAQGGRIEPPDAGLPAIGQHVLRGQLLATVTPAITSLERGGVREQLAQIESSIGIAEQRVARLSQLQGSVPQREIDEARRELDGLRQRRRALGPSLAEREVVRASASGVISVANVVTGQLIESGEVLFEIVDPEKLWVEAIAYDPAAILDIRSAVAATADGAILPLELIGRSLTLRQQAVPVLFRITRPSSTLKVGTPVTVILQEARTEKGIVLPAASIVGAANGEDVIFEHVAAERFVPRPIRLRPLDGERVVVLAGIGDGSRVVTAGAELLNQIR